MEIRIDASDYQQLIHAAHLRTDRRADQGEDPAWRITTGGSIAFGAYTFQGA